MGDIKFLHDGTAVVVVDAGDGAPLNDDGTANPDYRAARVARLVTEEVEPEQFRDTDPTLDDPNDADPTRSGTPGELRGFPAPPASSPAAKGPVVTTRSTATEEPADLAVPALAPLRDEATADTTASADRVAELEARNAQLERELQAARNDLTEPANRSTIADPASPPPGVAPLP